MAVEPETYPVTPASIADAGALAALHYLSHTTSFAAFASPEWVASRNLDDYHRQWRDFLSSQQPGARAWAAWTRPGGWVIGMVKVAPMEEKGLAQLSSMHVHPDYHGRGIGRSLMQTAMDFMVTAGYKRAILGVIQANDKAIKLYERSGWRVLELRDRGLEGVPIATYQIDLA